MANELARGSCATGNMLMSELFAVNVMTKSIKFNSLSATAQMQLLLTITISLFIFHSAAVRSGSKPKDGDLRLIDGTDELSGTLQVYRGYGWGYICDDNWNIKSANIACKSLQMDYATRAYKRNFFKSPLTVDYLLDDVQCKGNEKNLTECFHRPWGSHNCRKGEQAGVSCFMAPARTIKPEWNPLELNLSQEILNKFSKQNGVELDPTVKALGQQDGGSDIIPLVVNVGAVSRGAICPDKFRSAEANVACRQLKRGNYGRAVKVGVETETLSSIFPLLIS
ncbi:hypothetical protein Ciccas_009684 [Cichlidogyrus casuarinus]|uniref:SRCR domain-containing protein n=1 Tax=Cichlidogyrus casuarinus TaxID=1844966 RepID=A0ABD2PWD5_9PLAT